MKLREIYGRRHIFQLNARDIGQLRQKFPNASHEAGFTRPQSPDIIIGSLQKGRKGRTITLYPLNKMDNLLSRALKQVFYGE